MATERNPILCRVCSITRGNHATHQKTNEGRKNPHAFEQRLVVSDPDVVMECSCSDIFRLEGWDKDLTIANNALRAAKWRLIEGKWKCPPCGDKHDRAKQKKLEREMVRHKKELAR